MNDENDKMIPRDEPIEAIVEAVPQPIIKEFSGYAGVGKLVLKPNQKKDLLEIFPDDDHEILPTGEVYVSQVHFRRKLNEVFGPGGWALVPRGPFNLDENVVTREYCLVGPGGVFLAEAIGEQEYYPSNERQTYATACEAAKSNALTRCCKDIGIASECWDKRFCEKFKKEFCIQVWRKNKDKPEWRRKDADPFWNETGEVKEKQKNYNRDDEKKPEPSKRGRSRQEQKEERITLRQLGEEMMEYVGGDQEEAVVLLKSISDYKSLSDIRTQGEVDKVMAAFRAYKESPENPFQENTREPGAEG